MQAASAWCHPDTYLQPGFPLADGISSPSIHLHWFQNAVNRQNLLCLALVESDRHMIRIRRIPVVGIPIVVHIARIRRIAAPDRSQPPVAPTQN